MNTTQTVAKTITDEIVQQACLAYGPDAFPARMRAALSVVEAEITELEVKYAEACEQLSLEQDVTTALEAAAQAVVDADGGFRDAGLALAIGRLRDLLNA